MPTPARQDLWLVRLEPVVGREQAGQRPALVISVDVFNESAADLAIVLPVTSRKNGIRSHVEIAPDESGLARRSFVKCEDIRSISVRRLRRRIGRVPESTMASVEDRLRILLGL